MIDVSCIWHECLLYCIAFNIYQKFGRKDNLDLAIKNLHVYLSFENFDICIKVFHNVQPEKKNKFDYKHQILYFK